MTSTLPLHVWKHRAGDALEWHFVHARDRARAALLLGVAAGEVGHARTCWCSLSSVGGRLRAAREAAESRKQEAGR